MDSDRIVEVLHDCGEHPDGRWSLGSGFVLRSNTVVTAAHVLGESDHPYEPGCTTIRTLDGDELSAVAVVARNDQLDVAVLAVPGLTAPQVEFAHLDRSVAGVARNVTAVGFPNYKQSASRPAGGRRETAQPVGSVPTIEGVVEERLVLKLNDSGPATLVQGSQWAGLSGAGVFHERKLLGIVVEHRLSEGPAALHFVQFSAIAKLAEAEKAVLCSVLGLALDRLPPVQLEGATPDSPIVVELTEIRSLQEQGHLEPSEASILRLDAYRHYKGWTK